MKLQIKIYDDEVSKVFIHVRVKECEIKINN